MSRQSRLRPGRAALALLAAALVCSGAARAQIFVGIGPAPKEAKFAAPVSDVAQTILRHLPNTLEGLKLSGEVGDLRWPVYFTAAQAASVNRLHVGYVSAVSILPDASTLEARVNGTLVGREAIDAPRGLRVLDFAVPAGLLRAGYNAVSLAVEQRHRVDCSVAATYELWTKVDPAATGFVLTMARTIDDLADMAALLPKADGTMPIHIVMAGKTNPVHLRHLIEATQRIALAARALQPAVDFGSAVADPYGVNLALGTRAALVRIPQLADQIGTAGPLARLVPASGNGRPTIILTGSSEDEVDQAIATITPAAQTVGTAEGLRAAAAYPAVRSDGDERHSLHDLGLDSQDFSGRFFRKSFNLMLPADFLASDYGRGTFDLAGGYASGLARDAQVRVDLNGRSAGVIKLPNTAGDVFKHNQLFLPLSMMRGGLNRIDIFAKTPRPADADCTASDAKRFLFLDTSELVLPKFARVQRLPDLAATANGGLPYTRGHARLVVPKPDRETMAAALSLTARAAVAAGTTIPFTFSTKMPDADDGSTLVVSPARALDPAVMTEIGLDPIEIEAAWRAVLPPQNPSEAQAAVQPRWWLGNTDGPAACRLPTQAVSTAPGTTASAPDAAGADDAAAERQAPARATRDEARGPANDDLLEQWSGDAHHGWRDDVAAATTRAALWFREARDAIHWPAAKPAQADGIASNASLVLAQAVGAHDNVTTIVTAPDGVTLRAAVACLFDPQVWSQVHGRLAVLDGSRGTVTATDAKSFHYVASGSGSLANSRLVIAGWFSLNPLAFVAMSLLTALFLSGTTLWFVRGVGRRPE